MPSPRRACQAWLGGGCISASVSAESAGANSCHAGPGTSGEQGADATHCVNCSRCHTVGSDAKLAQLCSDLRRYAAHSILGNLRAGSRSP